MVRDLIVAGVVAMVAISAAARAEYPDRPVRLIVPFAPGGANDLIARSLADKLGKVLSRPFIIENRPGGGTVIGTAAVASSPPDGYTLLLISPAHTINPHISKTLPFNPLTDFTPIAQITRSAYVLVTAANSSIASVRDLMAGPSAGRLISRMPLPAPAAHLTSLGSFLRALQALPPAISPMRAAALRWLESFAAMSTCISQA